MNDSMSLHIGDLVWAKMKGYCAWPGRIVEASDQLQKARKTEKSQCVYFFGSHNYAWIEDNNVFPYLDHKAQMMKLGKPKASFDKAVAEIETYMKDPAGSQTIITPARKKSLPKVRQSIAAADESGIKEEDIAEAEAEVNDIGSGAEEEETPKKVNKVPVKKNSTQKKPKAVSAAKKKAESDATEVPPAKRARATVSNNNTSSPARNYSLNNNNNDSISSSDFASQKDYSSPVPRSRVARAVIERSEIYTKPEYSDLDVKTITDTLKSKKITASTSKFGFIGLGIMGSGIVKNLINSGHEVFVYNRTHDKTQKFEEAGARVVLTPSDVVEQADITFSCISDPQALKDTIFGNYGVNSLSPDIASEKGYVEMTTIDADTSRDIESALSSLGMHYLEAQIHGTKQQAEEGKLIILAAGSKQIFDSCQTCFEAMGRNSFFVGETGNATKMNLVLQAISGVTIAGLADSLALAKRSGLKVEKVMEIVSNTNLKSDLIMDKGYAMVEGRYHQVNLPLQHLQKDLALATNLADSLNQPLSLTAIANEAYKNCRRVGLGESDASAIHYRASN